MNITPKTLFKLLLSFTLIIYIGNSCRKIDLSNTFLHEENFSKRFFETKTEQTKEIANIIELLKKENEKTGFVNKLPARCGLPVWEKSISLNTKNNVSQFTSGTDTAYIIPLTENNENLSSIIIAIGNFQSGYTITCYTQSYLYQLTHGENVNTADAEKALHIFFLMENITFGTTSFYHIPPNLFINSTKLDSNGNKTIKLDTTSSGAPNSSSYVICVYNYHCIGTNPCIPATGYCDNCTGCVTTSCISISNDDPCPICLPPPPPPGGGGGGGGSSPPCSYAITNWYGENVVNPNPCIPPPPLPPNPCDTFIGILENDATFKATFNWLNQYSVTHLNYESGYIVSNRAQNLYFPKSGNYNEPGIDWADALGANTLVDGVLHAHFDGLSAMFSPQDVVLMAQIYLTGHARDTNRLFSGVTSTGPNPYLIKVNNTAAFRTFAQKIAGVDGRDEKKMEDFRYKYRNKFNSPDLGITELEFLEMLQAEGGLNGLGVYRSASNCHNWQKLGLNSVGGVSVLNCY